MGFIQHTLFTGILEEMPCFSAGAVWLKLEQKESSLKLYMEGKTYDVSRIFGEGGILMEGSITYKESDKIESFEEK